MIRQQARIEHSLTHGCVSCALAPACVNNGFAEAVRFFNAHCFYYFFAFNRAVPTPSPKP